MAWEELKRELRAIPGLLLLLALAFVMACLEVVVLALAARWLDLSINLRDATTARVISLATLGSSAILLLCPMSRRAARRQAARKHEPSQTAAPIQPRQD